MMSCAKHYQSRVLYVGGELSAPFAKHYLLSSALQGCTPENAARPQSRGHWMPVFHKCFEHVFSANELSILVNEVIMQMIERVQNAAVLLNHLAPRNYCTSQGESDAQSPTIKLSGLRGLRNFFHQNLKNVFCRGEFVAKLQDRASSEDNSRR